MEKLRQEGYDGRLLLITKENHLPYDRTKLSKVLNSDIKSIALRSQQFYDVRHFIYEKYIIRIKTLFIFLHLHFKMYVNLY